MTEEDASDRMTLRQFFAVVSSKKKIHIIVFDSFFFSLPARLAV